MSTFPFGQWLVRRSGFGAMQLAGPWASGPPDRAGAIEVLQAAIAAGIDHIDTAQYYGPDLVNELIRDALYPYPDGLAIVSKVASTTKRRRSGSAARWHRGQPGAAFDRPARGGESPPAQPGPGRRALWDDCGFAVMVAARDEGLIAGIGLSNISLEQLQHAAARTGIVCVQNLFHLADRGSAPVLDECLRHQIAFVPFCPLGLPRGQGNPVLNSPVVHQVATRLGATVAQVALQWLAAAGPERAAHCWYWLGRASAGQPGRRRSHPR